MLKLNAASTAGFLVWTLCAASAAYWGLPLTSQSLVKPSYARTAGLDRVSNPEAVYRMFPEVASSAVAEVPLADSSRFKLLGLMAPEAGKTGGYALLSIDGKPSRAFPAGASLPDGYVLKEVSTKLVTITSREAGTAFTLELAGPPPASTGTLPSLSTSMAGPQTTASPPPGLPPLPPVPQLPRLPN